MDFRGAPDAQRRAAAEPEIRQQCRAEGIVERRTVRNRAALAWQSANRHEPERSPGDQPDAYRDQALSGRQGDFGKAALLIAARSPRRLAQVQDHQRTPVLVRIETG